VASVATFHTLLHMDRRIDAALTKLAGDVAPPSPPMRKVSHVRVDTALSALTKTAALQLTRGLQRMHTPAIGGSPFQRWTGSRSVGVGTIPRIVTGAGTKGGRWAHAGLAGAGLSGAAMTAANTALRTNDAIAEAIAPHIGVPADRVAEYTPRMLLRSLNVFNPANRELLRFYGSEALRQAAATRPLKDYGSHWYRLGQLPGIIGDTLQRGALKTVGLAASPRAESLKTLGRGLMTTSLADLKASAPYRTAEDIARDATRYAQQLRQRWQ
jgi:hypothetical protein